MNLRERRILGRYDTPRPLAQALSDWAIVNSADRVLEPSCGGGAIVRSIATRIERLGNMPNSSQVVACDIDERAIRETLRFCAPYQPKIIHQDFLSLSTELFFDEKFDAIVANPPYTRLHDMSLETRDLAKSTTNLALPRIAGLWVYFTLHSFKFLKTGGRMALLLPESLLHAYYGRMLIQWFSENFKETLAVSIRERCFVGDGAQARVVAVLCEGAGQGISNPLRISECDSVSDFIEKIKSVPTLCLSSSPRINGHAVPHLIHGASAAINTLANYSSVHRLDELIDIRIGTVTGDNRFFLFDDAKKEQFGINKRHLKPIVSKFNDIKDLLEYDDDTLLIGSKRWLLCPNPMSKDKKLLKYLETYPKSQRYLNKTMLKRSYWQVPALCKVPDAFFRYMGNSGPRMVLNRINAYCTNTLHCAYFKQGITRPMRQAVCLMLYSSYSQLSAEFEGRQYGSGVLKLEPSEAGKILILLNNQLIACIAKNWRQLQQLMAQNKSDAIIEFVDDAVIKCFPDLTKKLSIERARQLQQNFVMRRRGR